MNIKELLKTKKTYEVSVCPECGSHEITVQAWIWAYSNEIESINDDNYFCANCQTFFSEPITLDMHLKNLFTGKT